MAGPTRRQRFALYPRGVGSRNNSAGFTVRPIRRAVSTGRAPPGPPTKRCRGFGHPRAVSTLVAAIPSPPTNVLHVGPFTIHIYGLCYAVAVIAAVAITGRRWVAQGGSRELVYDVALWGFPAGIVGGRLYYLATTPGDSFEHWWGPLAVWHGGLGIWGGIALGTIVGVWRVRRAGAEVARFLDAAAPALLVAQAIGRIGNYFNQELFGRPTDLPWAVKIDPEHRPARYLADATFHPTFLYEVSWNLLLAAALVWLGHHRSIRPPGLFALYVAGYCAFRIVDELLRVDPAAHLLGLRWNLLVAIVGTLAGLAWYARSQRRAATPAVERASHA
jgi:prolipoprotein diacylglyceryl transferase